MILVKCDDDEIGYRTFVFSDGIVPSKLAPSRKRNSCRRAAVLPLVPTIWPICCTRQYIAVALAMFSEDLTVKARNWAERKIPHPTDMGNP
jgi:hypothetical protein